MLYPAEAMAEQFDLGEAVRRAVEGAMRELRTVNVLIAGRTGVGKSTLINAVFAGQLAETGQGRPVTASTREVSKEGIPIRILDTRGLETAAYAETLAALEKLLDERLRERDPDRHIHVAWLCIGEDSRRVEQSEIELHEMLDRRAVPIVGVITKAQADRGFRAVTQELLPRARMVVRVRAEPETLDDGHVLPPHGLAELVDATLELVPASHRRAFVASQKASIALKVNHAHRVVLTASTAAGSAALTPIPVADAVMIVPIQIGMIAGISATFGMPMTQAMLATLVASATGAVGATVVGRAIVGSLLKLIPGGGTAIGGVISAATATTVTAALGETYILTLKTLFERTAGEPPGAEAVESEFKKQLAARFGAKRG